MPHCTPDELIDIVEETRSPASVPHLASCAECQQQLAELRALMADIGSVAVPEPPAAYWDQLSADVRAAVAAEPKPRRAWRWPAFTQGRALWPAVATLAAAVVLAVVIIPRQVRVDRTAGSGDGVTLAGREAAATTASEPAAAARDTGRDEFLDAGSDASFMAFMGGLVDGVDLEQAASAGLTPSGATTDAAVAELSGDEQAELQRLIKEALAGAAPAAEAPGGSGV